MELYKRRYDNQYLTIDDFKIYNKYGELNRSKNESFSSL